MKITLQNFILITLILIALTALIEYNYGIMNAGDWYVGTATVVLAAATFFLVWESVDASKKERRREHLNERLKNLYSPLIGLGINFEKPEFHSVYYRHLVRRTMGDIRCVYSYLASSALKDLLDLYYNNYYSPNHMPNSDTLKALRVVFTSDFEELTKEYKELTISEAEEKRRTEIAKSMSKMLLPK